MNCISFTSELSSFPSICFSKLYPNCKEFDLVLMKGDGGLSTSRMYCRKDYKSLFLSK